MKKFPIISKAIFIFMLTLLMMIPVSSIMTLVNERDNYRQSVLEQITTSSAGE